uniref:Uncharacterized protein n=1 Tax=Utricularia reniformis TaxID=192314 RepID=A0A1Y0B3T7_9LAMI|nr:hypothetical protein AEK19_MT1903 [Utricularia reniformis]ART32071.1 hypothetical protein AEK19_MT1903 [Utricularia reniformis]
MTVDVIKKLWSLNHTAFIWFAFRILEKIVTLQLKLTSGSLSSNH